MLGEAHYDSGIHQLEEDMIKLVMPEYLLHELLDIRYYDPRTKEVSFLRFTPDGKHYTPINREDVVCKQELHRHFVEWAEKYGLFLVGMDLSDAEHDITGEEIRSRKPHYQLTNQSPEECVYRERRQGERMVEYANKTSKPLIAIMGADHRRPKSGIHPILQRNGIQYVCIDLTRKSRTDGR